jgi:hypothetical protein
LRGVAIGKHEDSFKAIPEILACSTLGNQARDAEVPQIPQMTCLVEVLEEREATILGEEVLEIPGDGVQTVKVACARCRSCRSSSGGGRCLGSVILWGRRGGGGKGCSSAGCHRAWGAGSVGRRGGGEVEILVNALLEVPHVKPQPTQINQTFCGVDGVRRWRPGKRLSVRVGCDAVHDTNTPTCVELLGDLGTDV